MVLFIQIQNVNSRFNHSSQAPRIIFRQSAKLASLTLYNAFTRQTSDILELNVFGNIQSQLINDYRGNFLEYIFREVCNTAILISLTVSRIIFFQIALEHVSEWPGQVINMLLFLQIINYSNFLFFFLQISKFLQNIVIT